MISFHDIRQLLIKGLEMMCRLTVTLSDMGAFTLSVPLLLHLGLHLGDHLLHSSQLWNARNSHVWHIQHSDIHKEAIYVIQVFNVWVLPQPPSPAGSYLCPSPPARVPSCSVGRK